MTHRMKVAGALAITAVLALGGCLRDDKGTSFERPIKYDLNELETKTVEPANIVIGEGQTAFVYSKSLEDMTFPMTACDFSETTTVDLKERFKANQGPCPRDYVLTAGPDFSFESDIGLARPVMFGMIPKITRLYEGRKRRYVVLFSQGPTRKGLNLRDGRSVSFDVVPGKITVIGDPFDPANDPQTIANALLAGAPQLALRLVVADVVNVSCKRQKVTVPGLIKARQANRIRCTLTE